MLVEKVRFRRFCIFAFDNNHPNKIKEDVIDKVLMLRKEYQLGSWRIKLYLERYHDIKISESSVAFFLSYCNNLKQSTAAGLY